MNSNLAKVGKPTRWPPGQSGNPAGKPPGTRTAFSQGFIRDFALVWAEEGLEAVRKVAKKSPEAFVAIAARICPNDVRLTLEQAIPGGMSLEDYLLMREAKPTKCSPVQYFSMCSGRSATVPRTT